MVQRSKFRQAAVASSHPLASECGSRVLREGGNAVDAAIATSAVLCVTQNNLCGLGGDLFALIKRGSGIQGLNASGPASENASLNFFIEKDLRELPSRGPLSALTVPGIVDAWDKMLHRFGSMELRKLLQPAVDIATNGFEIGTKYLDSISNSFSILAKYHGWRDLFCLEGLIPSSGSIFKQRELASTLLTIASDGTSEFYEGDLATKIASGIAEQGGLLTKEDFMSYAAVWDNPLKTNYRGLDIYETAPNSQGATVLLWLNMLEEFGLQRYGVLSDEFLELFVRTCLKAYRARAKWIGDPSFCALPNEFVTKKFASELLAEEDLPFPTFLNSAMGEGDTTYFCIVDSQGDGVSAIQSNYMGFGSGIVPKGTGFVMNNRGSYFSLDPSHHNCIAPKKKTFHTLCACLAQNENEEIALCLGSMGGDVQPQVQIQLLTNIVDHGFGPEDAIDLPRKVIPFTIYENPKEVLFEPGSYSTSNTATQLVSKMKLKAKFLASSSSLAGHAQAIVVKNDGTLEAGADPRGEGRVAGF